MRYVIASVSFNKDQFIDIYLLNIRNGTEKLVIPIID